MNIPTNFSIKVFHCLCLGLATIPSGTELGWSATKFLHCTTTVTAKRGGSGEETLFVRDENEVLIANESDKDLGYDHFTEARFARLLKFDGMVVDTTGKTLRKLKKSDLKESTMTFGSVYQEHRTKYHELSYPALPYIVRRNREGEYTSLFFCPRWDPQRRVEVEKARYD